VSGARLPIKQAVPTVEETLQLGWRQHQAGDLCAAESQYRQALARAPANENAWCFLGMACHDQRRYAQAEHAYQRALQLRPDFHIARGNLGNTLRAQGRLAEAEACYRQALRCQPDYTSAHSNLGALLHAQGRLDEAATCFETALRLAPRDAIAHTNLAAVRVREGRCAEALASLARALEIAPGSATLHAHRAAALLKHGCAAEASASAARALELDPRCVEAHVAHAAIEQHAGRCDAEIASLQRALEIDPRAVSAQVELASALLRAGRLGDAGASAERALEIDPGHARAHTVRGLIRLREGRWSECLASVERALEITPQDAEARHNHGVVSLLGGRFKTGWRDYEWRLRLPGRGVAPRAGRRWAGEPLRGRSILLHCEQGFGDTLQFIRYARLLREQGARVVVCAPELLLGLLERCEGIERCLAYGARLPACDFWTPLLSIPGVLGTELASIPGRCGYLAADPARVEQWARRFAALTGHRVAVCWKGSPVHVWDADRSFPLALLAPLAALPGLRLISVQTGYGTEQLAPALVDSLGIARFPELEASPDPFSDLAAALRNVDLVVTCDTAVAHLAGALEIPTWLALPIAPDWRWLLEREDTPWYPTLRLFRQQRHGDWATVFARMRDALAR
jgi:tetratricopeptide (TPR) repeat protein